jgi:hypothetical protein
MQICNMCNIPIYFCNIRMKHLQHNSKTSETLKTYGCNMHLQRIATSPCCLGEWRLVVVWSSPEAAARRCLYVAGRRRLRDVARRQCPHDWEREPDPLGSHSCRGCRTGPPLTRVVGAVVPPCRGPLGPPRHGLLVLRHTRGHCATALGCSPAPQRERDGGVALEARMRGKAEVGRYKREER